MNSTPGKDDVQIGGQAVIEGVMMRGETSVATAVRKPDNQISVKREEAARWSRAHPLLGLPFIRGMATLAETMVLGISSLSYSAAEAEVEGEKLSGKDIGISLALSLLITVALFIMLPAFVFSRLRETAINTLTLNLIEGAIRISIFTGFLLAVNLLPDMRRVFQYHGAEHKTIMAYSKLKKEPGFSFDSFTPDRVRDYSRIHPSCGTSFLLMVLLISIFTFSLIGRPSFAVRVAMKLALLPVIAGISYEIIRMARRENAPFIFRMLVFPGMLLQKLTTREPDPGQIEVAIEALKAVA